MKHRKLFLATFTGSGLWLTLSPLMMIGGTATIGDIVAGDSGTLIIMGMLAMMVAGLSVIHYNVVASYLGLLLGLAVFIAPLLSEFTDAVPIWSSAVLGLAMSGVAFVEFVQDQPEQIDL